jgi:hypothetical protein
MADTPSSAVESKAESSPAEMRDPFLRKELKRALIWLGLACVIALLIVLVQPLLIIFAGVVLAALFDGGVRLLGRVLPIGRGWRLLIVVLLVFAFLVGTFILTGVQVTEQVTQLRSTLELQANRFTGYLSSQGLMPGASDVNGIAKEALGSVGRVTSWVGTAIGAITSMFMILILGLFIAMDPGTYSRGLEWLVPTDLRPEFAKTMDKMGETLRRLLAGRLLGMAVEGVASGIALAIADGDAARYYRGHPRVHPERRRDRDGRADGRRRIQRGGRYGLLGDRHVPRGADDRRLCDRADGGEAHRRSAPCADTRRADSGERAVRHPRARACGPNDRDDQDGARATFGAGGGTRDRKPRRGRHYRLTSWSKSTR